MWQNQWQFGTDLSKSLGAHQITFGGGWERAQVTSVAHTRGVGGLSVQAGVTGNALGDFMLGRTPGDPPGDADHAQPVPELRVALRAGRLAHDARASP